MKKYLLLFSALVLTVSMWATQYVVQPASPNATDNLRRAIRGDVAQNDGDTLLLVTGDYYETSTVLVEAKQNLVVMASDGAKPVVHLATYMEVKANITFDGIKFDGGDSVDYAMYLKGTSTEKFVLENCEFSSFHKYCIYSKESAHTDSIFINNSFFHDNTGVSAIYMPAGSSADLCNYVAVTNTTICNMGTNGGDAGVIDVREKTAQTNNMQLLVDHVTIYNLTNTYSRIIQSYKSNKVVVSNSIIAQPASSTYSPTYLYGGSVTNCLTNNVGSHRSGPTITGTLTGDPKFKDPANLDFTLQANSPAIGAATDSKNLGDPRWGVAAKDTKIQVEPGTGTISAAVAGASAGDTLVLSTGEYFENTTCTIDKQLTILAAQDAKPVVKVAKFLLQAPFEANGIEFYGYNTDYMFDSKTDVAGIIAFKNCTMRDSEKRFIYVESGTVNKISIDNCIFKNYASDGAVLVEGTATTFEMKNSTMYNLGAYAVRVKRATTITLDHCTFCNVGKQAIRLAEGSTSATVNVSNCVVSNATITSDAAYYLYAGTVYNSVYNNTGGLRSGGATQVKLVNDNPQWVDTANFNLNFPVSSPLYHAATDGSNIGDPRWTNTASGGVDIPATLPVADAILAGEEWTREDGWIKRGDKKATTGTVTWFVNALKTGQYDVSVEVSCDNTANLIITVYDADEQVISSLDTVSQKSGEQALGSVTLPEKGTYRVVATCAQEFSHIWFKNVKFDYVKPAPTASFKTASKDIQVDEKYTQTVTTNSTGAVTYTSSNETAATVNATTGEVTGVAEGSTTITATIAATDDYQSTTATYIINVVVAAPGRKYEINPGTDVLAGVVSGALDNDTVVFNDGEYIENYTREFSTKITFMAASGARPVIKAKSYIKAKNSMIVDGIDMITEGTYAFYFEGSDTQELILKNATIKADGTYAVRIKNNINRLMIDNCVLSAADYIIYAKATANLISVTNSTFLNCSKSAIYLENENAVPVTVNHCTFYNTAAINKHYIIHASNLNSSALTVSNCVMYNPTAGAQYGVCGKSGNHATVTNCMINNCGTATANTTNTNLWEDDPQISVSELGAMFIQPGSPIINKATDGANLGDPRWKVGITISEQDTTNALLAENKDKALESAQIVRSLTAGMYNTICLPFALSADQIAASDLAGSKIIELTSTSLEDKKLYLNFTEVDAIEAGKGYLIEPAAAIVNPVFNGVTITETAAAEQTVDAVKVIPTFIVNSIPASPANLYLYLDNTLYYAGQETTIMGMRLYYNVISGTLAPARMRIGQVSTPTDLDQVEQVMVIDGKFIQDGQMYIMKNGVVYNAQGQIVK